LTEQGVHEGGFARIEFADDDDEKELIELQERGAQIVEVVGRRLQRGERGEQIGKELFLVAQEGGLLIIEEGEHNAFAARVPKILAPG
jgi:hypothetical protein